jgi:hypothetical protein
LNIEGNKFCQQEFRAAVYLAPKTILSLRGRTALRLRCKEGNPERRRNGRRYQLANEQRAEN